MNPVADPQPQHPTSHYRDKLVTTLKAKAAMRGIEVHDQDDGGFLVRRWGLTREVPNIEALTEFLRTMGVAV